MTNTIFLVDRFCTKLETRLKEQDLNIKVIPNFNAYNAKVEIFVHDLDIKKFVKYEVEYQDVDKVLINEEKYAFDYILKHMKRFIENKEGQ